MIIPKKITLVNQENNLSCAVACIAMVTEESLDSVEEVVRFLEIESPLSLNEIMRVLVYFEILPVIESPEAFHKGYLYIACAPSLNTLGGLHSVVIDAREGDLKIYDPQDGNENMRFYTEKNACFIVPLKIIDIYQEKEK